MKLFFTKNQRPWEIKAMGQSDLSVIKSLRRGIMTLTCLKQKGMARTVTPIILLPMLMTYGQLALLAMVSPSFTRTTRKSTVLNNQRETLQVQV